MKKQTVKAFAKTLSAPALETDPAKNAAADKAIRIIMNEEPAAGDDDTASWGVPNDLLKTAGSALANRHCFALCDEEGSLTALITPIRFFKAEGHCSDQSGPVDDLLPKCGNAMESTWECYDPAVKTPVDFAKHLQQQGFQWSRKFQDYIDGSLTKGLSKQVEAIEDAPAQDVKKPLSAKTPRP